MKILLTLLDHEIGTISGGDCECCCGYPYLQQDIGCFETPLKCYAGCAINQIYYANCNVPCQSYYDCNADSVNVTIS